MPLNILSPGWQPRWPKPERLAIAVIAVSALLLLPVVYAGVFNHPPAGDDYENAIWDNFGAAQANLYFRWTGRYFSSLLLAGGPWHWHSLTAYRVAIMLLIVSFALATAFLIGKALAAYTTAPKRVCLAAAAAAVLLIVNNMDSLVEAFYWYAGAMTYVLSAILMAFLLRIIINVDRKATGGPLPVQYILSVSLIIMIIGCNEVIMVLCDAVCFGLLLYYRRKHRAAAVRFYLLLCIVCGVCSAIAVLAPGNAARQAEGARNIWMVPPTWLYFTQKIALKWLLDPFLLLYSVIFLVLFGRYRLHKPATSLLAAFLVPCVLFFLLSFPGHYVLGTRPPARVYNIVYLFFVFGWMFFLLHLRSSLHALGSGQGISAPVLKQLIMIGVIIGLLVSFNTHDLRRSNIFGVIKSLAKGTLRGYSAEMDSRYALFRGHLKDTVAVPAIKNWEGNVLALLDISANPGMTRNKQYAWYWHVAAVRVLPDTLGWVKP